MAARYVYKAYAINALHLIRILRQRMWEHELLEVHVSSADESKLKLNMYVNRVGRNLVGFSGTVDWQYDVDNETMV